MRHLFALVLAFAVASPAAALDPESKTPYQLRIAVHTGDHPALTRHFRAEVTKAVTSALQAALGPLGSVEAVDLNETPVEKMDPVLRLVAERGPEGLDGVTAVYGPKTHFVFVDFADGKYEVRTRQHDGTTGFVTPFVRRQVHGDRGFVGRLAGLAVAQDFGAVGTFDPTGPQVQVVLKAGDLGPVDAWVKRGDVFAAVQVREVRRSVRPGKTKDGNDATPAAVGNRIDGVLLQVVDAPRNGICVCKLHNRYKGLPPKDAVTLGYRCVRLGTGEGPLRLQLTDAGGVVYRGDTLQPRAGADDFPDPGATREQEEMTFADGVFTAKVPFRNVAFVLVRAGDNPVARIPVEIYPDRVAVRTVSLTGKLESPVMTAAADLLDRVRNARVIQAKAFDEVAELQKKEKPKALEHGQAAYDALYKEAEALKADLARLKERYKEDAPPGLFVPAEEDVKALEGRTRELRGHLTKLRDVIKIENDPATAAARKLINGLALEAEALVKNGDYEQAIPKYEEILRQPGLDRVAKEQYSKALDQLKRDWGEPRDSDHAAARKFVYEVWPTLEKPADVQNALAEARRAVAKCKAVGDKVTLLKMHQTGPLVLERFAAALDKMQLDDEDKKVFAKLVDDLQALLTEVGKELGADR
jgi:tetratricopeptide (TPR) repeat protein